MQQIDVNINNEAMLTHINDAEELEAVEPVHALFGTIVSDDFRDLFISEVAKITNDANIRDRYINSWDNSKNTNSKIILVDWVKKIRTKTSESVEDLTREKLWNEIFSIQRKNEISRTCLKFQTLEFEPVLDDTALEILSTYELDIDRAFAEVGQLMNRKGWGGNEASQLHNLIKLYKVGSVDLNLVVKDIGPILLEGKTEEDLVRALGVQYSTQIES